MELRWRLLIGSTALFLLACAHEPALPTDADLENFIDTVSRCTYVERAFSGDRQMLVQEMSAVNMPEDWMPLVDSLLTRYGADPDFWYEVFSRIAERSRESSLSDKPIDVHQRH